MPIRVAVRTPFQLTFRVYGIAQPKGSTKSFVVPGPPGGPPRTATTSDNPKLKDWQRLVSEAAWRAVKATGLSTIKLELGAVAVTVWVYLPRPQKYVHQKWAHGPSHLTKPDVDKLARGITDALTGVVWRDDSQVTDLVIRKRYVPMVEGQPTWAHVDVCVETTGPHVNVGEMTAGPDVTPLFAALDEPKP